MDRSIQDRRRRIMIAKPGISRPSIIKPGIILSGAMALALLGGAVPAQAFYDYDTYGGPHQTWCDVNPDCNGWNKRLHGAAYQSNAADVVTPINPKQHRPAHKRSHDVKDR
jgi:hypothetical protein